MSLPRTDQMTKCKSLVSFNHTQNKHKNTLLSGWGDGSVGKVHAKHGGSERDPQRPCDIGSAWNPRAEEADAWDSLASQSSCSNASSSVRDSEYKQQQQQQ